MGFEVKILADSISTKKCRLITLAATYPRIIHSEMLRHRTFCLAGDSVLEFDLPAGQKGQHRRLYKVRIDEFVRKWNDGAIAFNRRGKRSLDTSWIIPDNYYSTVEIASQLGLTSAMNINQMCRNGYLPARKNGRQWLVLGNDVLDWRNTQSGKQVMTLQHRLRRMRIRQFNEKTGDIQTSHVVGAVYSGEKEVYEVHAGEYRIAGSENHNILTTVGWKTIGQLRPGDNIVVRKFGVLGDERRDPRRLKKIDGVWRNDWQRAERKILQDKDPLCRLCRKSPGVCIHHFVPVYQAPELAFDVNNITLLCNSCHEEQHSHQDWHVSQYLYGAYVEVDEVVFRGVEPTYDLSIAGEFPNFVANGVVVHNSRCAASSRAIPVQRFIDQVLNDPYIPEHWGKNQKGMQAGEDLDFQSSNNSISVWLEARDAAVLSAQKLLNIGVHKQLTNRLLEPFQWMTEVITGTDWDNFFHLRIHPDAHPDIQKIARMMFDAINGNSPRLLKDGEWHLPLVEDSLKLELSNSRLKNISVGRVARVSYLRHNDESSIEDDENRTKHMLEGGHMSPFEHVATPSLAYSHYCGNLNGWVSYRKTIPNEHDMLGKR